MWRMVDSKYGKHIIKDVVRKSPHPEITSPTISLQRKIDKDTEIDSTWICITQPFVMEKKAVKQDLDRFLIFVGSDPYKPETFTAEVEFSLDGKKHTFTGPKVAYIPAGTSHFPLDFKRVDNPLIMADISVTPENAGAKAYIFTPVVKTHTEEIKTYIDGKLIREQKRSLLDWNFIGKESGGGRIAVFWYFIKEPQSMYEPPHAHSHDQFTIHLGGDPLDFGDFRARIDMWLGEEAEPHFIDSAAVVHMAKGLVHRGVNFKVVDRPFMVVNIFMNPAYQKSRTLEDKEHLIP
jgi:hypothetical protein